jgi:SAM-dependent methyltransferase
MNERIDTFALLPCHVCGGGLHALSDFAGFAQVTSDCRPWHAGGTLAVCPQCGAVQKPATQAWLDEAGRIYAEYAIYSQSGGVEQSAFESGSGANTARSNKIVEWLGETGNLRAHGRMLDIGCGNGAFLRAFSSRYPQWQMAGLELGDQHRATIEAIPGVTHFHTGSIDEVDGQFDLIVLIHALEHIPDPARYLRSIAKHLEPGGLLLIEVPDLKTSPFDILIADHTTHFTIDVLTRVVVDAGFVPLTACSGYVPKELSLLARFEPGVSATDESGGSVGEGRLAAEAHIEWLRAMLDTANRVAGVCGIFGTSISATWLAASLGERAAFFIDEDTNRIGRSHLDRPIHALRDAPHDVPVFVPLRADIAAAIANRLGGAAGQFILPPSTGTPP